MAEVVMAGVMVVVAIRLLTYVGDMITSCESFPDDFGQF